MLWSNEKLEAAGKFGDNFLYKFMSLCQKCYEKHIYDDTCALITKFFMENAVRVRTSAFFCCMPINIV